MATKEFRIENAREDKRRRAAEAKKREKYREALVRSYIKETKKTAAIYNEEKRMERQQFFENMWKVS